MQRDDRTLDELEVSADAPDEQTRTSTGAPRYRAHEPSRELRGLERIGRYLILDQLGAGGMGVVVSAYDPELDRKLAIKLIRFAAQAGERARQRMLREAQALAKLAHPNVIAVYDVGTVDAQIYIAMEFVAGCTLTTWLARRRAQPFDWRAVLEPFVQAGRGLMAAHEAGLIHRDFKPDNVLVGDDARVRVVDFGLARGAERDDATHDDAPTPIPSSGSLLDREVTEFGSLLGTPAYMPPERLHGHGDDARADQYSFAVALWEGLYGGRPYVGATMAELFDAVLEGSRVEPPSERRAAVPDWLHRVLLRALEREPDRRWPSMAALLSALQPPPPRSRWGVAIGLGLLAVVGVAIGVRGLADDDDVPAPCTGFEQRLEGVWDDGRRRQLRAALLASQRSYAGPSADLLDTAFTDWTTRWTSIRTDACEATALRAEQSPAMLDLRMSCLDRRLAEFDALVDVLVLAGPEVIDTAPQTIAALPELDACSDLDQLARVDRGPARPSDPERAATLDRLERALDELDALYTTGAYVDGLARAEALRGEIRELDWVPLRARHARLHGVLLAKARRLGEALSATTEAIALARALDDDHLAATATLDLLGATRYEVDLADEFDRWAAVADAELGRLDEPLLAARMQLAIGDSRWERADQDGALAAYQRALALREAELGPDAFEVAEARQKIADTQWPRGEVEQARAIYRQVQQTYTDSLGPDHPALSNIDNDLGAVAWMAGDYEAAIDHYQSALDRCLRTQPRASCTSTMSNLGATYAMQGKLDEARPWFEDAVEATRGDAELEMDLDRVGNLDNLAELEALTGNRERARTLLEEARVIRLAKLGEQHPDYARSLLALAELDLDDGHPDLARTHLERTLALREGFDVHVILRARIHWALARALAGLDGPQRDVEAQLDAARADFTASKVAHADELNTFEASAAELVPSPR